jgi:hypothetical protein
MLGGAVKGAERCTSTRAVEVGSIMAIGGNTLPHTAAQ